MKIKSLRISNVLSFKYCDDINLAEQITFDDGLNIIIGENGAGKSTALEVVNFLFKRVLYKQFNVNQDLYSRKLSVTADERRQILTPVDAQTFRGFRLEPNWNTEGERQTIRIEVRLDAIDLKNIENIRDNYSRISTLFSYTTTPPASYGAYQQEYTIDIYLDRTSQTFQLTFHKGTHDFGFRYLSEYNFYKGLIEFFNLENPDNPIPALYESFTLISSYRNYHAFDTSISLRDHLPTQQMQQIRTKDFSRSLNDNDQGEPAIFGLVRLRVAEKHFSLIAGRMDDRECEENANSLPFIVSINKALQLINMECKIRLIDLRTWQYAFELFDRRRDKVLKDVNSLSAGQKAIVHLIFEAYGRGDIKGGVVVIDEPEIHLHHQFQHQYLQVIRELNKEQSCQYILVTHSEALINATTINQVKRFALTTDGYTTIKAPSLTTEERILIKILDNTRSTYAFFAKKVLLVEGDSDRYFFKAAIQDLFPEREQEIAVLETNGKGNHDEWKALFASFGLSVFGVNDLDFVIDCFYAHEKGTSLKTPESVAEFKVRNPDWEQKIENAGFNDMFILKNGDLEHYLAIPRNAKGLPAVIDFCNRSLSTYLRDSTRAENLEIRSIVAKLIN